MRTKQALPLVAMLALLSAACQTEAPTAPLASEPMRAATAGGAETNIMYPISLVAYVPCAAGGAGELILLSGTLHELYNVTVDANGTTHVKVHVQPQRLTGDGLTTGDRFQGTGVTQYQEKFGGTNTFTYVNNFRMIGQGAGNNLLVHENIHVTVNANGEVTSNHDNLSIECR